MYNRLLCEPQEGSGQEKPTELYLKEFLLVHLELPLADIWRRSSKDNLRGFKNVLDAGKSFQFLLTVQ